MSSLTFVYEDSTAVLGPLSRVSEPHAYDLCREHASGMTAPRGWELLRVAGGEEVSDDLLALADAVRPPRASSAGSSSSSAATGSTGTSPSTAAPGRPRESAEAGPRHLHVLRGPDD